MPVPSIVTDTSITVVVDCRPHVIASTHPNFGVVRDLLARGEATNDNIMPLVDIPRAVEAFMQGHVKIEDGQVFYKDRVVDNQVARHIMRFMRSGDDKLAAPLIEFLSNLMDNPSFRAVQGLYDWIEKSGLPLTSDGHLLAWKIVGPTYMDLHSGRFNNSVGQVVTQDRNSCDEDPNRTCSSGLHFCSYDYLPHYGTAAGNRIMIVKINPRDVIAFPADYQTSKGRCCRYEVVGEVARADVPTFFPENTEVYTGFDPVASKLARGQRWITRDGSIATVVDTSDPDSVEIRVGDDDDYWYVDREGRLFGTTEDPNDLISLWDEMTLATAQVRGRPVEDTSISDVAVGQVWSTRTRGDFTITSIDPDDSYTIKGYQATWGASSWTPKGSFWTEDENHNGDLIRRVS